MPDPRPRRANPAAEPANFSRAVVSVRKINVDRKNANGMIAHCMLTAPAPEGLKAGDPATCTGTAAKSPDGKLAISGTVSAAAKPQ